MSSGYFCYIKESWDKPSFLTNRLVNFYTVFFQVPDIAVVFCDGPVR